MELVSRHGRLWSTQAGCSSTRCLALTPRAPRSLVAEALERALVVGPAAFDLDPDLEIDARVEELLELDAGFAGNALELLAVLADDHGLVAGAIDDHCGEDAPQIALGLELLDFHGDAVGQLVTEQSEELLAQEFGGEEALAAIGDVVFLEHRRAF